MVSAKEAGFVLSIDQASNLAGVSLWKDGVLTGWTVLESASPKDGFGRRLVTQINQLTGFLDDELGDEKVKMLLFEGVKSSHVLACVGAFCTCPHLIDCKFNPRHSFISALSWKKMVRDYGLSKQKFKEIKGIQALKDIEWDFDEYPIVSEDVADSILIYLCWAQRT
jgi:hypothetical protein